MVVSRFRNSARSDTGWGERITAASEDVVGRGILFPSFSNQVRNKSPPPPSNPPSFPPSPPTTLRGWLCRRKEDLLALVPLLLVSRRANAHAWIGTHPKFNGHCQEVNFDSPLNHSWANIHVTSNNAFSTAILFVYIGQNEQHFRPYNEKNVFDVFTLHEH